MLRRQGNVVRRYVSQLYTVSQKTTGVAYYNYNALVMSCWHGYSYGQGRQFTLGGQDHSQQLRCL